MAVALTALVVALGGTSYAARAAADSVDTKAIKNYAVTHSKVASDAITTGRVQDGSLEAKDFKADQIPQGPARAPGARGPAGPAGPSGANGKGVLAWAAIGADGTIREAFNLEQSNLVVVLVLVSNRQLQGLGTKRRFLKQYVPRGNVPSRDQEPCPDAYGPGGLRPELRRRHRRGRRRPMPGVQPGRGHDLGNGSG